MNTINKISKKIKKSQAKIISVEKVPGFIRITSETENTDVTSSNYLGGYIKLVTSYEGRDALKSISIAKNSQNQFTLDFVDHANNGGAANFARNAQVGDLFTFRGPGTPSNLDLGLSSYIFSGDKTAFPAILAHIKRLINRNENIQISLITDSKTSEAKFYFKEIENQIYQHQTLADITSIEDSLIKVLKSYTDPSISIWFANHKSKVDKIKTHILKTYPHLKTQSYFSSYWH